MNQNQQETPNDAEGPFKVGETVGGRYVLRRLLGRGGAAMVFAAEHTLVRRPVALKLPLIDDELREMLFSRLRRETEALSRVRHPAVVDVIDAGESNGMPFLAMQLLEGRTLAGLVAARGKLDVGEVVKVGVQLAAGLAAVHAAGIVHRDVKPSNVLVTRDAANQIRLFDFGTARLGGSKEPEGPKLTQSGAILGTPEYMAPEVLLSSSDPDPRGDVYALGVTLYECLTGAVPHEGALGQLILKLATTEAPLLTTVRPDVPKPLAEVVKKALCRDPAERFSSMADLAVALAKCAEHPVESVDVLRRPAPEAPQAASPARPPPLPPQERRREHARAPFVALARIERTNGSAADGRIEDVSAGGVLVVATDSYASGEAVRIRFGLPVSGRVVNVSAKICWSRASRGTRATGLEFVELPDAARAEITQYVTLMGGK